MLCKTLAGVANQLDRVLLLLLHAVADLQAPAKCHHICRAYHRFI